MGPAKLAEEGSAFRKREKELIRVGNQFFMERKFKVEEANRFGLSSPQGGITR